ncbi:MAG: CDP-glycerol glycerophosphotransferase family protein, partial [Oscillospiraceae bacterium]|nr:CDP-glycerol glycerophosphotransferase family protein [Oscillospiraceae bacterium]
MEQFFVVYLQHGVLHASLYAQNSAENARADKVVVSSAFEMENYREKYHYQKADLIPTGMARYDHIDRNKKPKGRILYAPTWRSYLTQNLGPSKWDVQKNRIIGSEYYKGMKAFLESEELTDLLEREDLCLEVKLHPIIASATELFDFQSERIRYAESEVEIEDYDYFITDFSSFVFDYAYLCRPILYFVPDYEQFSSGMGHYRELDLPFEKAFGELARDSQTALSCLQKMVAQKGKADPVYAKRMAEFYLPMEGGAAEGTYQAVKKAFG